MIILVPYFGDLARFRPLLDKWVASYVDAGMKRDRVVLLTDNKAGCEDSASANGISIYAPDLSGFSDLVRPGQPFDVKGALVAAYLRDWSYPTLVLDADAVLVADPDKLLLPFKESPIAMPIDAGAVTHGRAPRLRPPFESVRKKCAGVMWFGASEGRSRLVAGYRRAFEEMRETLPWDGSAATPHLLEQHAWSVACHWRGGGTLPALINWSPRHLGDNAHAVVLHDYGLAKWA